MAEHETSGLREFYEDDLAAGFDFRSLRWMILVDKVKR
jgi:hypothetical protein